MPGICGVCVRAEARYTCPRCEVNYCSLQCYQSHNGKCTENFYRDQVQEELKSSKIPEEERRKLEKVMQGLNKLDEDSEGEGDEEAEDEEEDEEDLPPERLADLLERAERGELGLEDLTESEAKRFHSALKRGVLGQSLGVWDPWWQKVAVVDLMAMDEELPEAPGHLCCPGDRKPHPSVALTALEALYSYVHTLRAFNGDWSWDPLQAAAHLLHLAPGVCEHKVYESVVEVLRPALDTAAALPGGGFGTDFDRLCLQDVALVVRRGCSSAARALREATALVQQAAEAAKEKPKGAARLFRGAKKLEFLGSFAFHHEEVLLELVDEVEAFAAVKESLAFSEQREAAKRAHGGVALPTLGPEEPRSKVLLRPP